MRRVVALLVLLAGAAPAWVESVEFPWDRVPRPLWQRELVRLKNIGIAHVSLPSGTDAAGLAEVVQLLRRLSMEADLEGPVPAAFETQARAHGGPLTETLPASLARISVLDPVATTHARDALASGAAALLWTDFEPTLAPDGYHPGAVTFTGEEQSAAASLRRNALLSTYWSKAFASLREIVLPVPVTPGARQFTEENGASVVSVINNAAQPWAGDLRVLYPSAKHPIVIPGVRVPPHDALWLPVNIPLTAGPLCRGCTAFANGDHLVYATAELTTMEYENGILAMEFSAPSEGEVILQLTREPSGPLVAGGRPAMFDWDAGTNRARLKIPAGAGTAKRVRIGLAIEPPDSTAFFEAARVLMIGETNQLTAEFSSESIAQRSRMRSVPSFAVEQQAGKEPLHLTYMVKVPETAVHGDYADIAIEADGIQMSHARPQLLRPVELLFPDAFETRVTDTVTMPAYPATIPVNQKAGREFTVTVRNNAPEIRTFTLEPKADGLDFSPAKLQVTVGASVSRDLSFRIFAADAAAGLHAGTIAVSGAAVSSTPIQFAVVRVDGQKTVRPEDVEQLLKRF